MNLLTLGVSNRKVKKREMELERKTWVRKRRENSIIFKYKNID